MSKLNYSRRMGHSLRVVSGFRPIKPSGCEKMLSTRPNLATPSPPKNTNGGNSNMRAISLIGGVSLLVGGRLFLGDTLAESVEDFKQSFLQASGFGFSLKTLELSKDAEVTVSPMYHDMEAYIKSLQLRITSAIEDLEKRTQPRSLLSSSSPPAKFIHDHWLRQNDGGEGITCVISDGNVIEKGGVNVSVVHGMLPPNAVQQMRANHSALSSVGPGVSLPYSVCGLSLVLHAKNPKAPTAHMNVRYFETYDPKDPSKPLASWFGGGLDLTPSYLYEEDAEHFHGVVKNACEGHGKDIYPSYKTWCDEYFFLPHRGEARGVGGIFFDDLDEKSAKAKSNGVQPTKEEIFDFVKSVGDSFVPAYVPILEKRWKLPYTPEQWRWQQIRRGRYAEFNLVIDRGTKFGLMTPGARIESILMTIPLTARWEYCSELGEQGTEEGRLMEVLREPREWLKAEESN
uniref:coproporphyrinogen oxidase n=1 Tax=Phaffia rhodozyma TaxID=264483 RepID=A0A1I9Q743_PHARH|nr:coproporphyrinogen III oxidase [Phaffia rhodozyma]